MNYYLPPVMPCMGRGNSGLPQSYKSLEEALNLVKKAVEGEREDELFYDYLISKAPTQEEKDIITTIRNDEVKHNKMFREIYKYYTGVDIVSPQNEEFEHPKSYIDGIKKALFGELGAVERYRIIRAGIPDRYYRDMVFEILTDEQKHADKYNYILNLNRGMTAISPNVSTNNDKFNFTPDDWVRHITPLVNRALAEAKEGINPEHLYQEFILSGVLVGLGKSPQEAIEQVEQWEKTGESQLLAMSKMGRGFINRKR